MVTAMVTDRHQLDALFRRYPSWQQLVEALVRSPGTTASGLVAKGEARDATNANGSLEAMQRRGLVRHDQQGRRRRWSVEPHVERLVTVAEPLNDSPLIRANTRLGVVPRDGLPALARAIAEADAAEDVLWIATLADRTAGAVLGLRAGGTTTSSAATRNRLQQSGVTFDDMRVEDVAEGPDSLRRWARRVLGDRSELPRG